MNNKRLTDQTALRPQVIGSLDHVAPAEQMQAINAAMQWYFDAKDWLGERSKKLPEPKH